MLVFNRAPFKVKQIIKTCSDHDPPPPLPKDDRGRFFLQLLKLFYKLDPELSFV